MTLRAATLLLIIAGLPLSATVDVAKGAATIKVHVTNLDSQASQTVTNQYGQTDLDVQTRIADATDDIKKWGKTTGIGAVAISVIALIFGFIQWCMARAQSKRELRAYIHFTEFDIWHSRLPYEGKRKPIEIQLYKGSHRAGRADMPPVASILGTQYLIQWQNMGQTPAYNVHVGMRVQAFPFPIPPNQIFPPIKLARKGALGPSQIANGVASIEGIISDSSLAGLKAKTHVICIYGRVEYESFKTKYVSEFRFIHKPHKNGLHMEQNLELDEAGNDAT